MLSRCPTTNISPKNKIMRNIPILLFAFLMLIQSGCTRKHKINTSSDDFTRQECCYVFDENRISSIEALCDATEQALYDSTISSRELNLRMSLLADTLQYAIRHCQDFEFNLWMRGFVRHLTPTILFDRRVEEDLVDKYLFLPYLWNINRSDSATIVYTSIFRASNEMYDRFTNVLLFSKGDEQRCLFTITNFSDTVIKDVCIAFVDTAGNHKTLDQHDALFTDYQDAEPSVLRMLFPLDTFLSLLNNATSIDVQYQAKKSEIVMRHYLPESEKLFVENVFAKKNMP